MNILEIVLKACFKLGRLIFDLVKEKYYIAAKLIKILYETCSSLVSIVYIITLLFIAYYKYVDLYTLIIIVVVTYTLKSIVKKAYLFTFYKGMPIPKERMTVMSDDGKTIRVSNNNSAHRLVVYVNELENYLESKGLL